MSRQKVVKGVAIDATGPIAELDRDGGDIQDVLVEATEATDFALDVSYNGADWFNGAKTYSAVGSIREIGLPLAAQYVRLRVTTAAAGGNTADVYLVSAGE